MTTYTTTTADIITPETVKGGLTAEPLPGSGRGRRTRGVENEAYTAFCVRIITAAGRRVGAGDIDALADLATLENHVQDALAAAVAGLREFGYSWAQIADQLGITRQAAQQRWGGERP